MSRSLGGVPTREDPEAAVVITDSFSNVIRHGRTCSHLTVTVTQSRLNSRAQTCQFTVEGADWVALLFVCFCFVVVLVSILCPHRGRVRSSCNLANVTPARNSSDVNQI